VEVRGGTGAASAGGPPSGTLGPIPAWLQPWALLLSLLVLVAAVFLDVLILVLGIAGNWLAVAIFISILILILAILIAWWGSLQAPASRRRRQQFSF
jgi:hypothetical protein